MAENSCLSAAPSMSQEVEDHEKADTFEDIEKLGLSFNLSTGPTRENILELIRFNDGRYKDEFYYFHVNFNAKKKNGDGSAENMAHDKIYSILKKKFNLYKLRSTPGEPHSVTPGECLGRIRGNDEKMYRIKRLHKDITDYIKNNSELKVLKAHVIVSKVIDYSMSPDDIKRARRVKRTRSKEPDESVLSDAGQKRIKQFITQSKNDLSPGNMPTDE